MSKLSASIRQEDVGGMGRATRTDDFADFQEGNWCEGSHEGGKDRSSDYFRLHVLHSLRLYQCIHRVGQVLKGLNLLYS